MIPKRNRLRLARRFAGSGLALLLLIWTPAWGQSIGGVFALGMLNQPIPPAILQDSKVDGVALRYVWNALEPQEGRFNWEMLDRDISQASAQGKRVSLEVTPGIFAPNWVYGAGAAQFSFRWDKPWGPAPCSQVSFPIPWDPVYMSKWQAFVRAMGEHYQNNRSVVLVKVEGVNAQTSELMLPHSRPGEGAESRLVNCSPNDDIAQWQSLGYRPERVRTTWRQFAETYAEAFPNQYLALQTGPWGMPPIDDEGKLMFGRPTDSGFAQSVIPIGKAAIDGHFVIQNDGLQAIWSWPQLPEIAQGTPIAYQMAWRVTDDPTCRMNHFQRPCDPHEMLQASVGRGIEAGAKYLEIYIPDLLNPQLTDVITEAHRRLTVGVER
jgi:glycosyl hydrolase family 42 (putative beta-galactosidase)